uniref:Reverse transcriptase domain-containing protein n=1 Tax=Tanacetum cinerariifolium TaxID=118510 RepID=A0A6L2NAB2_TANCI|nr:reverse transcriptase domain-containing protein [Tanacetum cinerariifolium]
MGNPPDQSYKRRKPIPLPTFIKEEINLLRTMIKEHDQQDKIKSTPRRLAYADSDKEAPARPKPTSFTQRITRFKYHQREKLTRNIRLYEGNKDTQDDLGIFSAATEQEEWPMPIWCKVFHQTLGGVTRNWFNDLDPKSVDSFEELSQKFLEEFSQQNRYAKDPTEIHDIKRRHNEGLQAFMDRFKSESLHIKGVPRSYVS